ncbi:hypothetical protein ACFL2V_14745 [Pseudomonadota bacterium]
MNNILFTGLPNSNKTELVERTRPLITPPLFPTDLHSYSIRDYVAKAAYRAWRTRPERISMISHNLQSQVRVMAVQDLALEIAHRIIHEPGYTPQNCIVDLPMNLTNHRVSTTVFDEQLLDGLDRSFHFDYVVTVIDDARDIQERRIRGGHHESVDEILHWTAKEVGDSKSLFNYLKKMRGLDGLVGPKQHLIIPYEHSQFTLAQLLTGLEPVSVYIEGPITHLKPKEGDSDKVRREKARGLKRMVLFRDAFKSYAIVIAPMLLADQGFSEIEMAYTIHRDLYWFVPEVDVGIAFFPIDCLSRGTEKEIMEGLGIAKPSILIHPSKNDDVFGIQPTLHYRHEDELFEAIRKASKDVKPGSNEELLLQFGSPEPRYEQFIGRG